MARRTISLPQSIEDRARESAREGEAFSATVARLIERGRPRRAPRTPSAVRRIGRRPRGSRSAPERYLRELVEAG